MFGLNQTIARQTARKEEHFEVTCVVEELSPDLVTLGAQEYMVQEVATEALQAGQAGESSCFHCSRPAAAQGRAR